MTRSDSSGDEQPVPPLPSVLPSFELWRQPVPTSLALRTIEAAQSWSACTTWYWGSPVAAAPAVAQNASAPRTTRRRRRTRGTLPMSSRPTRARIARSSVLLRVNVAAEHHQRLDGLGHEGRRLVHIGNRVRPRPRWLCAAAAGGIDLRLDHARVAVVDGAEHGDRASVPARVAHEELARRRLRFGAQDA